MYDMPAIYGEYQKQKDESEEARQYALARETEKEVVRRQAKSQAEQEEAAQRQITVVRASDVATQATHWLWRDRVPMGGLTLIAGKGDTSKSTLLCQFAGWITTGDMKGEFYGEPRNVLYVVNEDSIKETVVPRLQVHGADTARVFFVRVSTPLGVGPLSLPRDIEILADAIKKYDAVAVFIDPLSANTTGRRNDQGEMRSTYQAVNDLATRLGVAIIGLAHSRKAGGSDVLETVIGSSEQTNVARAVHGLVMDDKEDGARILSCEKLNVGDRFALESLRFAVVTTSIECTNGEYSSQPLIKWLEKTSETASDVIADALLGTVGIGQMYGDKIRSYVINNGGECSASDVVQALKLERVNVGTLARSRKKAGIKSKRDGNHWVWYLPS